MKKIFLVCFLVMAFGCKNASEEKTIAIAQQEFSPEVKASIARGAEIYNNFCASCHLSKGEGIAGVFPPLQNSDWLTGKRKESIHAVKFGLQGPIEVNGDSYDNLMPYPGLSDEEVADVMNYIKSSWGNSLEKPVTKEEVAAIIK